MPRFLFGPADDPALRDRFLHAPAAAGRWATFPARCPSFVAAAEPFGGGSPDALLVWPGYASVPAWVWAAPVPVVALAHDPSLLWHASRHVLPLADLVLTDAPSAARLRRAGIPHARAANLYGLDRHLLAALDAPDGDRDLDVLFVGSLHPAVQGDRLPWVGRVAALAGRHRAVVATGVFGAEYRALLRRSRLVFNRSARGECNLRALEAAASGAVLLQEADNAEVPLYLEPHAEYAPYADTDLEAVVGQLLGDERLRRGIAARARGRVRGYAFDALVEAAVGTGGPGWDDVRDRAARRAADPPRIPLAGRVWVRASLAGPDADPALAADLDAAGDRAGLAALARSPAEAEPHLASAAAGNRVAAVGHAAVLLDLGRADEAVGLLREVLAEMDARPELTAAERETIPYPAGFDRLRVAWERAGYDHPGDQAGGDGAKATALRARAWVLLAAATGEVAAFEAAAAADPGSAAARAALGLALARAGRFVEAAGHLRAAADGNPFDRATAALEDALARSGDVTGAAGVRARRLAVEAATAGPPGPPPPGPRTRFVDLTREAFAARFGSPDTSHALAGFTPPLDTHVVLALVAHLRPRRVLEVGTAAGHMTANLTAFALADAVVFSLGLVAGPTAASGTPHQDYELPPRDQFARFLDHFGTGHKALLATADSRSYDFQRIAPLDFAFIDGGHDYATARSDSVGAYHALRPGGCLVWHDLPSPTPWVEVEPAVADLAFPEPVYRVAGTGVAFLLKGEGVGAAAGPDAGTVAVAWDGEFAAVHSLAHINRSVCGEMAARGNAVAVRPHPGNPAAVRADLSPDLAALVDRELPGAVTVRHRWPPDFAPPPADGPFVLVQPWEYGRLPQAWVEPILAAVDEVWVPSRSVLRAYVASGVPEGRVAVVPNGVDPDAFRPGLGPLPLPTAKAVRLLFVGGTIPRKGADVLLAAYRRAFTVEDDVCLVVKDVGAGTFYRGQTAEGLVTAHRADPNAPEVVYLTDDLPEADLARLYTACDALVHPYRGEGFALPVLEAMACGKPVVVTAGGPTDEFVPLAAGWKVPATLAYFPDERVGDLPTAGRPWWLEPDPDALVAILREVVADAGERQRRGAAARRAALGWTWARAAAAVEDRARVLHTRTPVRFRRPPEPPAPPSPPAGDAAPAPRTVLSDEPVVVPARAVPVAVPEPVPAVPRGRPRVSLTMIVRNEEDNLPACLVSVRDLVDEAVVIDTGSTDRTREVAASFGAVLGEFPWVDDFAAARNAALDHATGDYALWVDADDRLDDENRGKLRAVLAGLTGGNDAYAMKCLCVPDRPGAGATVVDHVRLFRRVPAHRWAYRVHEQILPALRRTGADVRWAGVVVRHVGYVDPAVRRRKLDRDLRLLERDAAERPGDPFTLFNLGSVYAERGDPGAAAAALERSLAGSHPKDSIVRKLYALLAQCRLRLGDRAGAGRALAEGRGHYPADAELLFLAANLARSGGDLKGAEALYRELVGGTDGDHFASVDAGLRAVKGRHNLAVLLTEAGRGTEAEGLWRAALTHDPHFLPALVGLGELYARAGNEPGLAGQLAALRDLGRDGAAEAAALEGRRLLDRKDPAAAAALLEAAAKEFPEAVSVRVVLSHARLAAAAPPEVLEAAFRSVLALDPNNAQARHNLEVLLRTTGRWVAGVIDPPPGGGGAP